MLVCNFCAAKDKIKLKNETVMSLPEHATCKKCGGLMKPSTALDQTYTGTPDFAGSDECVTMSPGGSGKLIDCMKCENCGWSVT